MDALELQNWSQKLKISPIEILREEIEISILNALSQSNLGSKLIFKGGTALRLCYNSPRFSQDLDFNQKEKIDILDLKKVLKTLSKVLPDVLVKDVFDKRNTIFSLLSVSHPILKQDFSIKIEISKKKYKLTKKDFSLKTIESPINPLTPILYTYSLERILYEKKLAIKTRKQARDYFDLWFIGQKLNKKINIPKPKIHPSQFKGEINQFLPNYLKNWSKEFLRNYE